jgi:hypothetical protein
MEPHELSGTYTYRSFLNEPDVVGDFNKLQFSEAELTLFATLGGGVSGFLSWPTNDDDSARAVMDIAGQIVTREPLLVRLEGIGRKGSAIETFDYRYELTLARYWPETTRPRTCLVGSVIRAKDHGTAKAGVTASVIAVRRDFVEPRDVPGVGLAPSTIAMLAGKWHRLWHATWHTLRGEWPNFVDDATPTGIGKLGWGVDRPPRKKRSEGSALVLDNGAGEDFLFMHRWMIKMVRDDYAMQGLAPPAPWKALPSPTLAQVVYSPVTNSAGVIEFNKDIAASGNMVPLTDEWVKSQEYFSTVMRQWERNFAGVTTLASLSLGALGNLLEFTIHNAMHNRWSAPARDPDTGEPIVDPASGAPGERPTFDFSDKWSSPKYDYLGEFYSSHVNPIFWRLHGWVDDRIDDWFKAQEASSPGRIRGRHLHGVEWFEVNKPLVKVDEPFVGVSLEDHGGHGGHHDHGDHAQHGGGDQQAAEIETMLKVMALVENDGKAAGVLSAAPTAAAPRQPARVSMRFEMPGGTID